MTATAEEAPEPWKEEEEAEEAPEPWNDKEEEVGEDKGGWKDKKDKSKWEDKWDKEWGENAHDSAASAVWCCMAVGFASCI